MYTIFSLVILVGLSTIFTYKTYNLTPESKNMNQATQNIPLSGESLKKSFIEFLNSEIEKEKKDPAVEHTTTYEESSVECSGVSCKVYVKIVGTKEIKYKMSRNLRFKIENDKWVIDKEAMINAMISAPPTPEAQISEALSYRYNLSVYATETVGLEVLVNGVSQKSFKTDSLDRTTINALLYAVPGKNNVEIKFISHQKGNQDITYSYELRGYPKDAEGVLFNDDFVMVTSKPDGEIVGFVDDTFVGTKSIKFSFEGK